MRVRDERRALQKRMQYLPVTEGDFAQREVDADKQMIALYWGEKGDASVLLDIDATLKALA